MDLSPPPHRSRLRIPPAVPYRPGDRMEHQHVLQENGDALALLLWQALRDVRLWAGTPPSGRARLFRPAAATRRRTQITAAALPREVGEPLLTLAALLSASGAPRPCDVACACLHLHRWLGRTGARLSSLSFAEAAALATPTYALPALAAGQAARHAGLDGPACAWLRRAVGLARQGREWETFAAALVALGHHLRETEPAEAHDCFRQALRACRRYRIAAPALRGGAWHGLFHLAREHDPAGAAAHARRALRAYGPSPERRRVLHDYAVWWREQGRPVHAVALLRRLAPQRDSAGERLESWTAMAEAAADAAMERWFARAWSEAWRLLRALGREAHAGIAGRLCAAEARLRARGAA